MGKFAIFLDVKFFHKMFEFFLKQLSKNFWFILAVESKIFRHFVLVDINFL